MSYLDEYKKWCESDEFDEETKQELLAIKDDEKEIEDRFYKELEFGTGGLRGIIGAGTNRMNKYTVGKATQGLANYIVEKGVQDKGVVISYDSRRMSKEFSLQTALILCANGIKAYLFENLRPVPELSFSVRELGCTAGVMVTASHNPPKYNGYKVYWDDGAQVVPPADKDIISKVRAIESFKEIKEISEEEAKQKGLLKIVGPEMDDKYLSVLKKLILNPEIVKKNGKDLKVVYTPLHGTGNTVAERLLKEIGFENVYVVPEQKDPDGNFPTVDYPNPEDKKAFKLALELAEKVDADVVLATDPDADRLGIYAKDVKTGKYETFTGNMSGLLIAEYRISQMKEKGLLPSDGMLIKTIVSSNLADAIAKEYNLELIEVLTGFKNIGKVMRTADETGKGTYLFGFEESYGCLIGDYARDKDGISAVMALCEAAAYYREQGITLWDQMQNIYKKYGYFKETQVSIVKEGPQGAEEIKNGIEGENLNLLIGSMPINGEKISEKVKLNILNILNKKYGITENDLFSSELELVPAFKARSLGFDESMVAAYGQDDKICAYASLMALMNIQNPQNTAVCILADKEEIGSMGNTGMESHMFDFFVSELLNKSGINRTNLLDKVFCFSKMLSSDVDAGYDPIYASVSDKLNAGFLGKGIALTKYTGARGKAGASDANAEYVAWVRNMLEKNDIKYQLTELGKVDVGGGGTIAYILANKGIDVIDCGIPLLSMHSPYEVTSKFDIYEAFKCYKAFWKE